MERDNNNNVSQNSRRSGNIAVVVLGEIGRSPRMQYHSVSLCKSQLFSGVRIIGYSGSSSGYNAELKSALESKVASVVPVRNIKNEGRGIMWLFTALWKVFILSFSLLIQLLRIPSLSFILVQNPPSVPTLLIVNLVSMLKGCKVIIDWHNYGHTLLAMSLHSKTHIAVRIYEKLERFFGQRASFHLCVTKAMKEDLKTNWGINATVLYDRPPLSFHPSSITEQHQVLFCCLSILLNFAKLFGKLSQHWTQIGLDCTDRRTPFTEDIGTIQKKRERMALLVSSTSWTPDEDFSILLDALKQYSVIAQQKEKKGSRSTKILLVITGKGPLKEHYEKKMKEEKMSHVETMTMWLSAEDYAVLLGSADLGISLHSSSSGLDLPMKVVDMFGSGLPVCALNFEWYFRSSFATNVSGSLNELVQHGKNGLVFSSSEELTAQILVSHSNDETFAENNAEIVQNISPRHYRTGFDETQRRKVAEDSLGSELERDCTSSPL